ncbi:MAG TPA: ABC transporter permease, partial [Chitinophagaceae bacterium]|nr:ABC transporter permease [Chitinophagaceae bacterium]
MFKNYLKLALRGMGRKKLYTIINLTGLGVASAFCILVYWYVQHEESFDRFHANGDQLYRLEFSNFFNSGKEETKTNFFSFMMKNSGQQNMIQTPTILAVELQKDFSEIEHAVRIIRADAHAVRVNNQSFKEENNAVYADADFFKVFSFSVKEGNASTVLAGRNQIVLSEKVASKYFGKADPVGKTLLLPGEDSTLFTVSGVTKDFPVNSSFQFDLIMPRESHPGYKDELNRGLNTFSDLLIIQFKKGINIQAFQKKLDAFGKRYFQSALKEWAAFPGSTTKPENFHIYLRPFAKAHYNASSGWWHYTDLKNIYQLSCLAVVILLIACLNYILLTLTGTVSRSQEVGVRKTVGAPRRQIILQFYIETQLLAFIAVIIGFLLAVICLPLFSSLIGSNLQLVFFSFQDVFIVLFALGIVLGVLAGIYPALVMSGLKPLNMMRKFSAYRLNPYLSKFLVVTQFSVCIILIISTLVISSQMRYMNEQELGFDKEQVVSIENPYGFFPDSKKIYQLRDRLYHYASMEPAIQNITSTWFQYQGYNSNNHIINGERVTVEDLNVDYNYFTFFNTPIIKGRNFSPDIPGDSAE